MTSRRLINVQIALFIGALLLFFFVGGAFAGEATVTWTNPTTRTDGSALLSSQIGSTRVEWGTCSGSAFGTAQGNQSTTGAATSATINNLAPGTYCFRAATIDTAGLQSGWSNIASKVVPVAPPTPPVIVTVATTAYVFKLGWRGAVRLVQSGTVPLGVACQPLPGLPTFGLVGDRIGICGAG
jgi:hypothetical protein